MIIPLFKLMNMINNDFNSFIKEKLDEGLSQFSMRMKYLIFKKDKSLFDVLDLNNDKVILEPLLFAYFSNETPVIPLRQILLGYIKPLKRFKNIKVFADAAGIIYLPKIGYFKIEVGNHQNFELNFDKSTKTYTITCGSKVVNYLFYPILNIANTDIEIREFSDPLIEPYFKNNENKKVNISFEHSGSKYLNEINTVLDILKTYYPFFFTCFSYSTRCLIPFHNPYVNSFATLSVHGTGFLNVPKNANEIFFIEDIVHQCGHIIFTTISYKKQDLFTIDPDTPLKELNSKTGDHRSIYVVFHGIFTELLMNEAFDICLKNKIFTGSKEHELKGRFAYILIRYLLDVESLNHQEIFTPRGLYIYNEIKNNMLYIYYKYGYIIKEFDLTNQPYTFSYDQFLIKNILKDDKFAKVG